MNHRQSYRQLVVLLGLLGTLMTGCEESRSSPPQIAGVRAANSPAKSSARREAQPAEDAKSFSFKVVAPKSAFAGKEVVPTIQVKPLGSYKINVEYPVRLDLKAVGANPDAISLRGKDAEQFDDKALMMKPKFTAAKSGSVKVTGEIKFSVCTDAHCLIKKRPVVFTTVVKSSETR